MKTFYQLDIPEISELLQTSEAGLDPSAVTALRKLHGENILTEARRQSKLSLFFSQFKDLMIFILFIAAGISFFAGEHVDAIVILAIIFANALMSYSNESSAEESIRMLKKMSAQNATVTRGGNPAKVPASELVPGDLVSLEAGDIVPADARLIESHSLKTDESSLTGESSAVEKITGGINAENLPLADQKNMVFKGTIVSNGSAKAFVTATGMQTELGKIAGLLDTVKQKTPLQKKLVVFTRQLAVVILIICLAVFAFGLWQGEPALQMFLTALSLAVAALPEALPAVITIALARGAGRMVKQKALIRKLPAVETLGSVTYICTDKTGTLTRNVMTVEKLFAVPGNEELLKYAMILDNEVKFSEDNSLIGDSTETALVDYALKDISKEEADKKFPFEAKFPFDSERMRMSTLHRFNDKWILFVKGAPIKVTAVLSAKYKDMVDGWINTNRLWAEEGLRVLFFAYKIYDTKPEIENNNIEKELDFLGIVSMIDPPREEVIEAIKECKKAGIITVMITGDQPLTAKAIALRLGIASGETEIKTGVDIDKLSEEEFLKQVKNIKVYARVSPVQKLRIVSALQATGEYVAMTGDGVNDAPSLRRADIGLAMGITGTDVSKEASDMILLDDNFATIVKAVKEGRRIYDNIRKFILYVLSCNLSEILTIFIAPILGFAIPLLPIHILWINLVTDGLPGIALVSEPAEKNIMNKPPVNPGEKLFAGGMISGIIVSAIIITLAALSVQWWASENGYGIRIQQSMVFSTLCFIQLGNALSVRSSTQYILSKEIFKNRGMWLAVVGTVLLQIVILYVPFFNTVFKTSPLELKLFLVIIATTFAAISLLEVFKYFRQRKKT